MNEEIIVEAEGAVTSAGGDAASIRNAHIKHEAGVRSIGLLYYLGGFLGLFVGIVDIVVLGDMVFAVIYIGIGCDWAFGVSPWNSYRPIHFLPGLLRKRINGV